MPAIQPARLKGQSARLAEQIAQPGVFVRELHHLLEIYADHSHRPGQSGEPPPLLASYNVPPPVMRQIWQDIHLGVAIDPSIGIPLCDALWAEPSLEHRLLATMLLGQLPVTPVEPVIERLKSWASTLPEERIVQALLGQGITRLRQEAVDQVLILCAEWLNTGKIPAQQFALHAMIPLIEDLSFDNLPALFWLLAPILRSAPALLRPDLLAVLAALASRSPQETAYNLRLSLISPDNPDTAWLIRQILEEFPPELQASLRSAMNNEIS